jgi:hypothetical protein
MGGGRGAAGWGMGRYSLELCGHIGMKMQKGGKPGSWRNPALDWRTTWGKDV